MNCFGKKMTKAKKSTSVRAKVMKRAHKLKKESKTRTFATALRMAWKEQNKKKRKTSFGKKNSRSRASTTHSRSSCFG